jgi:hypothetical protein
MSSLVYERIDKKVTEAATLAATDLVEAEKVLLDSEKIIRTQVRFPFFPSSLGPVIQTRSYEGGGLEVEVRRDQRSREHRRTLRERLLHRARGRGAVHHLVLQRYARPSSPCFLRRLSADHLL